MAKTKYFYIEVTKKNEKYQGHWYNDFIGHVF